ncbi:molecular chaperone DnaJ [Prochlorococcus sp. MIT 1341]|uniref:molecular chaperone DnaJ n=1 Tax=Prochlorococcus sp. MIT 1341 TaxID=3096221 RepID=UPI002A759380|nr:molecular chaperone DnaJ [Prochlorococcus sp. MIT 1341]
MTESPQKKNKRISVDLPEELVSRFDELKKEWGLRARGAVLKRLLEEVLLEDSLPITKSLDIESLNSDTKNELSTIQEINSQNTPYDENTALVLIGDKNKPTASTFQQLSGNNLNFGIPESTSTKPNGIDLPGFVSKRGQRIKESLRPNTKPVNQDNEPFVAFVSSDDIERSLESATQHWKSLYGKRPGETVVEAAMVWLARDIWLHTEGADSGLFTWTRANQNMQKHCKEWRSETPSFEKVMVIAGVLEDPFATSTLPQRMPTLIRRFVNSFKRSRNVTSFETLESTMTVHGALKLLSLPTTAGSALTLCRIRDAYKQKAVEDHPDAGGSTEAMRRLNEAYQLLKELYRKNN